MATESELRSRLAALKAQGKTESTSKEAGKIAKQLKEGSFDSGGGGFSDSDYGGTIQKAIDLSKQVMQPAIDTLSKSIDPLKERYNQLLDQIKGTSEKAVEETRMTQANELGRRGILPSSGLYETTVAQAVDPVRQQYGYLANEAAYNQQQAINSVNQAIAQLQYGAGQSGISTALQLLGLEQGQNQFAQQLALQQAQQDISKQLADYQTNAPYFKPESLSSSENFFKWLESQLNPNSGGSSIPPSYSPAFDGIVDGNWYSSGGRWIPIVD